MTIKEFYDSAFFLTNNIAKKRSKGHCHCCHTHHVSAEKGKKNSRKNKKKNSCRIHSQQQQQQPTKVLKQSNLDGIIVKLLDVKGFGDRFQPTQSQEFTCVAFQNCGQQPQFHTIKKVADGSLEMSAEKCNTLLFAEHGLYSHALEPKYGMYDRICMMNKGTLTRLSYNTNDGEGT